MPTGDTKVEIAQKKLLGLLDLRDGLLEYVNAKVEEAITHLFTAEGLFEAVDIDITGNDEISLDPTSFQANDGAGNTLDTSGLTGALVSGVPFENTNAIVYHVGMEYVELPDGVLDNPRTGDVQYRFAKDWVGKKTEPNSVSESGGTITLVVDSVFEAARDNTGRTVTVWLKTPLTSVDAEAIVQATVYFDAGSNKVDVPHLMGQETASTTASDYWVAMEGLRIERDTDLRLEAGVVYLGNVTGGGSGNPPSAKDLDDQQIYTDPALVFGDIVEVDANNHHKVAVKAYAAEAASWPQISVVPDGTSDRNMQIQKDGSQILGNDNFAAGAAKPDLVFYRVGPKTLTIDRGTNIWNMTTNPATDGIFLDSGYVKIDDLITAVQALKFQDVNTAAAQIPFSAASPDNAIDSGLPQNVLGAINYQRTIETALGSLMGTQCLSGGNADLPGGSNGRVYGGTFLVNGKLVSVGTFNEAVAVNTYVYLDSQLATPDYDTTTSLPLPHADDLLMAYFVSSGSPSAAYTIRRLANQLPDRTQILVGTDGLSGNLIQGAHFATVGEAVRAIKELYDPSAGTGLGKQFVIRVIGITEEADVPIDLSSFGGLIIEGGREGPSDQGGVITWTDDEALFEIGGTGGLIFRNFDVDHRAGTTPPSSSPYRVIWLDSSGVNQMLIDNVRYLNDQATALNGILRSTNTIANSRIQNVNGVGTFCLDWGFGFATFSRSVIRDCSILKKAGTEQTSLHNLAGISISGTGSIHSRIEGCEIQDFTGPGMYLNAGGYLHIRDNNILDVGDHGIDMNAGDYNTITGNIVRNVAQAISGGGSQGEALRINSDRNVITGNHLHCGSTPATPLSIRFESGADKNTAVGNDNAGVGISDGGANNFFVTATDGDPLNSNVA